VNCLAVDASGFVYVVGTTASPNFPILGGAQTIFNGPPSSEDIFVSKLNPEGTQLIYSTYLGGHGSDLGLGIAVDSSGSAYITGQTTSSDFPTTPGAFQRSTGGGNSAFVSKLNPAGNALIYSTYIGGSLGNQRANSIAVDSSGNAYIPGKTTSADFPTTASAFQRNLTGFQDAFVTKLSSDGAALAYSTLLGGDGNADEGFGIATDTDGFAYVVGHTASLNFPTSVSA